eukprot:GHVS01024985.1.p1 GENE.GHVS01024985.1~~GHVS01024985.1.p1  ORF type:complete len:100 (+),score=18.06 GHVS01024985.1:68-367(+)
MLVRFDKKCNKGVGYPGSHNRHTQTPVVTKQHIILFWMLTALTTKHHHNRSYLTIPPYRMANGRWSSFPSPFRHERRAPMLMDSRDDSLFCEFVFKAWC